MERNFCEKKKKRDNNSKKYFQNDFLKKNHYTYPFRKRVNGNKDAKNSCKVNTSQLQIF